MKLQSKSVFSLILGFALTASVFSFSIETRANVYATNIKLNGALNSVTNSSSTNVAISYILNEPATLGAKVTILSGTNIVRAISISSGAAGTLKGTNLVTWDGKDGGGNTVGSGSYNISITTAATGFTNWTQTSTDTNAGYYVFKARGIAVNTNPGSKYYGRVFVANAQTGNTSLPGDTDGILKLNADGSFADEGQTTNNLWRDDGFQDSPHALRYGQDDRIYGLDWTGFGVIIALDMTMATNQMVLTPNNYSTTPNYNQFGGGWDVFDVTDAGTTNGRLWLGNEDESFQGGVGIWTWRMTNGVANTNDTSGTQVVALGGSLSLNPNGGFMTDENSNVFVAQDVGSDSAADPRALVFANWDGVHALTNAAWAVGANDDTFEDINDTALSTRLRPTYVAYALSGGTGGIRVLNASNGAVVTNASQSLANLDAPNEYFSVAWDAVGNLYGANQTLQNWRVFSPPGTNQATTLAVETVQIGGSSGPAPVITSIAVNGTNVIINFTGASSDTPSAFTVSSATIASGPYTNATGAVITQVSSGHFQATVPTSGADGFYQVTRSSSSSSVTQPVFTSIAVSGTSVTLNFTGSTNDAPTAFTLLCSGGVNGTFTNATGVAMSQVSPGHFKATCTNGTATEFYRLKR